MASTRALQNSSSQTDIRAFGLTGTVTALRSGFKKGSSNPLSNLLSDEAYSLLRQNDLLNEKSLRDYIIRQLFIQLKADSTIRTSDAIKTIMGMYPYLQFDTIRKIVYGVYPGRKSMM